MEDTHFAEEQRELVAQNRSYGMLVESSSNLQEQVLSCIQVGVSRACVCVCEHVKESAWRSFNVPVVLFPTEQTWRSSRTNTGG